MPNHKPLVTGIAVGEECPVCSQEILPREFGFRRYTLEELCESAPLSTRDEVVDLLAAAIRILHYGKSEWERACSRCSCWARSSRTRTASLNARAAARSSLAPGETRFLTFTPCIAAADAVDRCP